MKRFIYADNAATTQLDIDAFEAKMCIRDSSNPDAAKDLQTILTKEKCTQGMAAYLETFENGTLSDTPEDQDKFAPIYQEVLLSRSPHCIYPVSYTHLDVYKRQSISSCVVAALSA